MCMPERSPVKNSPTLVAAVYCGPVGRSISSAPAAATSSARREYSRFISCMSIASASAPSCPKRSCVRRQSNTAQSFSSCAGDGMERPSSHALTVNSETPAASATAPVESDDGRDEHGAEQNGIEKAQAENTRTSVRNPGGVVLAGEGRRGLDALALKHDEYKVVLPCGHPLAERERIDIHELDGLPFLLLEHGGKTEVTELLEKSGVHPKIRFTTWEDYAIMAMAEKGLGVGILPELILQCIPYRIEIRPLAQPYYRQIGLAMKDRRRLSPAAQSFVSYLKPDAE